MLNRSALWECGESAQAAQAHETPKVRESRASLVRPSKYVRKSRFAFQRCNSRITFQNTANCGDKHKEI